MTANPVIEKLGRRLRLGVLGGGPGSVIGEVHRAGARLDDRFEVVGGVLSSNPERSRAAGRALGWAPERAYGDVDEMIEGETARPDGVDVVAIMTPNDSHYPLACRWLDAGPGRHLRQAAHHPPGGCPGPRRPGAGERSRLLHHLQLLRLSHGPPGAGDGRGRRDRGAPARPGRVHPAPARGAPGSRGSRLLALRCRPLGAVGDPRRHRHPCLAPAAFGHPHGAAVGLGGRRPGGARAPLRRHRRGPPALRERRARGPVGHPGRRGGRARAQVPDPRGGRRPRMAPGGPVLACPHAARRASPDAEPRGGRGSSPPRSGRAVSRSAIPKAPTRRSRTSTPTWRRRSRRASRGRGRTPSPSTFRPSRTGPAASPSSPPRRRRPRRAARGPTAASEERSG